MMENLDSKITKQAESLSNTSLRLDHYEQFMDKRVQGLKNRLNANDDERGELKTLISKSYEYTEQKVNALKSAIPITIDELGSEIERKMESISEESKADSRIFCENTESKIGAVNSRVDTLERVFNEKLSRVEETHKAELKIIHGRLDTLSKGSDPSKINSLQEELRSCKTKLAGYETELGITNRKLDDAILKIQALSQGDTTFQTAGVNPNKIEQKHQRMFDELTERISYIEYNVKSNTRSQTAADVLRRKQNVIIDQLGETENENIISRLNTIFDSTLNKEDRDLVVIMNAFRIGKLRPNQKSPRKIMIQFDSPIGKEIVIRRAKYITCTGNGDRNYYINEDLPETEKRKKNDLYKYQKYLMERGHKVERENDTFIINDQRWHLEQLNSLPIGDRLLDSRTIFEQGAVAFQSSLSPLSNLFPCRIKYNGKTYASIEHAYQFTKAIHHKLPSTAHDIKCDDNPYHAMTSGNEIPEDREWAATKVDLMERLIRIKEEQVPIFRETLQRTHSYKIIENTWSHFWGSNCPFRSNAVWTGQYKGLNNMGRLLERIRDGY